MTRLRTRYQPAVRAGMTIISVATVQVPIGLSDAIVTSTTSKKSKVR
ncbi:Uncharacterised protein [Mycobacterium tuberculosis]|uniref:Uncharacterized protein n=1 Tax=Mycobacterium tuberculosis TaxID=1773 RepID=A0A654U160_MYCTX|nr:Uncharacterised protein [Mycobacterium tuberculosis]